MTADAEPCDAEADAEPCAAEPDWWIYRCSPEPHNGIRRLPKAPSWRSFSDGTERTDLLDPPAPTSVAGRHSRRGRNLRTFRYQAERKEIHLVNMALLLRRPLLVTGPPGVGKSTLPYSIAGELGLGPVLRWSVTSRTTLQNGQYEYDAVGRLQDSGLLGRGQETEPPEIGHYLRLGPLGTALLPWRIPRVLLIDEIDKSDADFPNDLLHVFEEGEFTVRELARLRRPTATVMTADDEERVELTGGRVRCHEFPLVVMTSNGEREFPPAFLRRCIRLEIHRPDRHKLARLLDALLPPSDAPATAAYEKLVGEFLRKQDDEGAELANDQLLNAALLAQQLWADPEERGLIVDHLLRPLNEG
ncbi:AAA family ATPase [Streptomyces venezuelae]|uniref:AAA family ATPase n=1 Tax=Streptomyces venezuelae TaxID=54571 RepID=A0A5P2D3Y2_STRVZ|nr:MoxR family ATPase [Streptomyces venezuelae]QES47829.1 AAA family ATPase [Streptomyces venezuelae]